MPYQYKHAVLGGTFDHLHAGHKHILTQAFDCAKHITIGVTSDDFVKEKELSTTIQSHNKRKQELEKHLLRMNVCDRVSYEVLNDMYGSATDRNDIDSIVVTSDSEPNANKLNEKRVEHNLPKLHMITVPLLQGKDGETISSTRIRRGAITRNGDAYMDDFTNKRTLPQNIREDLKSPLGDVVQTQQVIQLLSDKGPTLIVAVGDIVTKTLQDAGRPADIEIIDYRTRRADIKRVDGGSNFDAINPAGTITKEAAIHIESALKQAQKTHEPKRIIIQGEEDLLALPAILLAPLGSIILYGQFDRGIVIVEADEKMKENVSEIIKQFE